MIDIHSLNFLHTTIYLSLISYYFLENVQDPVFETFTVEIFVHGTFSLSMCIYDADIHK